MLSQCTDIQAGQETLIPAINIVWVIIRVWLINMLQLYMVVMEQMSYTGCLEKDCFRQ